LKKTALVKREKENKQDSFNNTVKGYNMANNAKKTNKGKIEVTGYNNASELKKAVNTYVSEPKTRRSIMKRINRTPEKVLKAVFHIIPCNWNEVIQDKKERIVSRNKGHKKAVKASYVVKA